MECKKRIIWAPILALGIVQIIGRFPKCEFEDTTLALIVYLLMVLICNEFLKG